MFAEGAGVLALVISANGGNRSPITYPRLLNNESNAPSANEKPLSVLHNIL